LLNLEFTLLSPTPDVEIKDHEGGISSTCVARQAIPTVLEDRIQHFEDFLFLLNMKRERTVVIFTWLPSNTNEFYEAFFSRVTNSNISFFGISTLKSSSVINYDENYSFELQETFNKYENCKVIWIWHEPNMIEGIGKKLRRLPEFHSNTIDHKFSIASDNEISLNFYGGLSSFRGLGEILLIALFNPSLSVKIKGYGFSKFKIWRPTKYKLFRYSKWQKSPGIAVLIAVMSLAISTLRHLPNVRFDATPFESEEEFLIAISNSKFVFVGCKLPHSSGVALASLAAGVPVIWFGVKGEAVRTLANAIPEGLIRYHEIFIPGRIKRKLKNSSVSGSKIIHSWESMVKEIGYVKEYLEDSFK
jgi:hypothetical protein